MRILVVEDDALLTEGLTSVLTRAGHAVEHANTGRNDDILLTRELFDLVVLDAGFPAIDGFEVLRCLCLRRSSAKVLVFRRAGRRNPAQAQSTGRGNSLP